MSAQNEPKRERKQKPNKRKRQTQTTAETAAGTEAEQRQTETARQTEPEQEQEQERAPKRPEPAAELVPVPETKTDSTPEVPSSSSSSSSLSSSSSSSSARPPPGIARPIVVQTPAGHPGSAWFNEDHDRKEAIQQQLQAQQVLVIQPAAIVTQALWMTPRQLLNNELPVHAHLRCRRCGHEFPGRPFPYATEYRPPPRTAFKVPAIMCSPNCNVSFTIESDVPKRSDVQNINALMMATVYKLELPVQPAPPLESLRCYNFLDPEKVIFETIEQYRASFDMTHCTIEKIPDVLEPLPMKLFIQHHGPSQQKRLGEVARTKAVVVSASDQELPFNSPLRTTTTMTATTTTTSPSDSSSHSSVSTTTDGFASFFNQGGGYPPTLVPSPVRPFRPF